MTGWKLVRGTYMFGKPYRWFLIDGVLELRRIEGP